MAEQNEPFTYTRSDSPDRANPFPRIAAFFDGTIYFIERCGDLLEELGKLLFKSKLLIAGIALVIILVKELDKFIQFLSSVGH